MSLPRMAAVLLVVAGCWAAWALGGMLLAWVALGDLDPFGRIVLVFGFLTLCEAGSARLAVRQRH